MMTILNGSTLKRFPITLGFILLLGFTLKAQSNAKPASMQPTEAIEALYSLELITGLIENEIKYTAPPIEPFLKPLPNGNRNDKLALSKSNRAEQLEAANYSMQEAWLIKAGYCKTATTPEWRQAKKILNGR